MLSPLYCQQVRISHLNLGNKDVVISHCLGLQCPEPFPPRSQGAVEVPTQLAELCFRKSKQIGPDVCLIHSLMPRIANDS